MNEQLFQYVVYLHPTPEERKQGKKTEVVVPASDWTLGTEKEIALKASRAIPEEHLDKADRLEVAVRPF